MSPLPCTSLSCIWSRSTSGKPTSGKPTSAKDLNFGVASQTGYTKPSGPKLDVNILLKSISKLPIAVGAYDYFTEEADREVTSTKCTSSIQHHDHFTDPMSMSPDLTTLIVDHLVKSLVVYSTRGG